MTIEIIIASGVITFATYIVYRNFRKKLSGECGCCSGDKTRHNHR